MKTKNLLIELKQRMLEINKGFTKDKKQEEIKAEFKEIATKAGDIVRQIKADNTLDLSDDVLALNSRLDVIEAKIEALNEVIEITIETLIGNMAGLIAESQVKNEELENKVVLLETKVKKLETEMSELRLSLSRPAYRELTLKDIETLNIDEAIKDIEKPYEPYFENEFNKPVITNDENVNNVPLDFEPSTSDYKILGAEAPTHPVSEIISSITSNTTEPIQELIEPVVSFKHHIESKGKIITPIIDYKGFNERELRAEELHDVLSEIEAYQLRELRADILGIKTFAIDNKPYAKIQVRNNNKTEVLMFSRFGILGHAEAIRIHNKRIEYTGV